MGEETQITPKKSDREKLEQILWIEQQQMCLFTWVMKIQKKNDDCRKEVMTQGDRSRCISGNTDFPINVTANGIRGGGRQQRDDSSFCLESHYNSKWPVPESPEIGSKVYLYVHKCTSLRCTVTVIM